MSINQTLKQQEIMSTSVEEAMVIGGCDSNWIVQAESGTCTAKKAVSCLVAPEIGDKVLCVLLASGASSILAILERKQSHTTHLKFDGDLDISSSNSIRLVANERLNAFSGNKMSFDSSDLSIRSKIVSALFNKLNVTGEEANHSIGKIRILAKYMESVSETSRQIMNNSFRLVSGLESVKAGEILQTVKNHFKVQSKQATILAEDDARVNAKRVHLG